ncbi:MAG: hypothetical protein H6685_08775 [Deltaproteobacteria bacterium]|nr:hypothetical protein [Deltaproteobacteria bacterium]
MHLDHAADLRAALDVLNRVPEPDAIVISERHVGPHPRQTFAKIRHVAPAAPIIALLDDADEAAAAALVEAGAQDYLVRGTFNEVVLRRSVRYAGERKLLENLLSQKNQTILNQQVELLEKERLRVLLEMAGTTAHEVNNPLTGLIGFLELLEMDDESFSESTRDVLDKIRFSAERVVKTIQRIQNVHRYQTRKVMSEMRLGQPGRLSHRVLVIEPDNERARELIGVLDSFDGVETTRVRTGHEACEYLRHGRVEGAIAAQDLPDGPAIDQWRARDSSGKAAGPYLIVLADDPLSVELSPPFEGGVATILDRDSLTVDDIARALHAVFERVFMDRLAEDRSGPHDSHAHAAFADAEEPDRDRQ